MSQLFNLLPLALAETAEVATDAAAAAEAPTGGAAFVYYAVQLAPMILIFVVFYFILIRPQRKKEKEAQNMLANLKPGDRICTIGGIYGTISNIKDDVLTIEVGPQRVPMMFKRSAVSTVEELSVTKDAETLI